MSKMAELEKRRRVTGVEPTREELAAAAREDLAPVMERQRKDAERLALFDRVEAITRILQTRAGYVSFTYRNHKGVLGPRKASLHSAELRLQPYGARWYPGQWVLSAWCCARQVTREFSLEAMDSPVATDR